MSAAVQMGELLDALFARAELPLRVLRRADGSVWTWNENHYENRARVFYAFQIRRGLAARDFEAIPTQQEFPNG
jgi:hypothetical protein